MFVYIKIMFIFTPDNETKDTNQKHNVMKNTQLTTNEDRTERAFFTLLALALLLALMLISSITL